MLASIVLGMVWGVAATCDQYSAQDPPLYCDNQVTWTISHDLDPWTQSHKAYQLYYNMKVRYLAQDADSPSLDCLAIAQEFYCAYSFPYCDTDADPSRGVCSFLCALYRDRCPGEPYDFFCNNTQSTKCASGRDMLVGLIIGLIVV